MTPTPHPAPSAIEPITLQPDKPNTPWNFDIPWLESKGFKYEKHVAYIKDLAKGPEDSSAAIFVGNWPYNEAAVSLYVGGFGMVTNINTREQIEQLIQLLEGSRIDHPYCEEIYVDE